MKTMRLTGWNSLSHHNSRLNTKRVAILGRRVRLLVEALEERLAPAAVVVPPVATPVLGNNPITTVYSTVNSLLPSIPANLSFQDGLQNWHTSFGDTGGIGVVQQWSTPTFVGSPSPVSYDLEGNNFAIIQAADTLTTLSIPFQVGPGGAQISFSSFFYAGDYAGAPDFGKVVLYNDATPLATLYSQNLDSVGAFSSTPWSNVPYPISYPGNYTLLAEAGDSKSYKLGYYSYMGLGNVKLQEEVLPTVSVGDPITVATGMPVSRTVTFTDPALGTWSIDIDPGEGVYAPFTGLIATSASAGGPNSFTYQNTYASPGTYSVYFRIYGPSDSPTSVTDDLLVINVFNPDQFAKLQNGTQIETDTEVVSGSDQNATVGVSAKNGAAVNATLNEVSAGASVLAGAYTSDPTLSRPSGGEDLIGVGSSNLSVPAAFFDLRAAGVDASATLQSTFTVELDPSVDLSTIQVYYSNDGITWHLFQPDPAYPSLRSVVGTDSATGKEIVTVTVTYTKNSTPSIFNLHGTVFTVVIPATESAPTTTPVVSGPVASLTGLPPAASLTTTFSSDAGGAFVLRVSQGVDLSASRSDASSSSSVATSASITGGNSSPDNDVQLVQTAVDNNWLLRGQLQPQNVNISPVLPAAGDEQPNQPIQPNLDNDNNDNESDDMVQSDALVLLFAQEGRLKTSNPILRLSMAAPVLPAPPTPEYGTRLNLGWALVTAAIGVGQSAQREVSKKRRRRPARGE